MFNIKKQAIKEATTMLSAIMIGENVDAVQEWCSKYISARPRIEEPVMYSLSREIHGSFFDNDDDWELFAQSPNSCILMIHGGEEGGIVADGVTYKGDKMQGCITTILNETLTFLPQHDLNVKVICCYGSLNKPFSFSYRGITVSVTFCVTTPFAANGGVDGNIIFANLGDEITEIIARTQWLLQSESLFDYLEFDDDE